MKYNIAISGTFNVENYGDLLFPEVFKAAMQKRGLDFDLYMFSPGASGKKALDPNSYVYSIDEIDEINSKVHFDAVVIGGGALIHYIRIPVKLPNCDDFSDYNIHDSWYTPIEFAARNDIKVLFNLPQVPFEFADNLKEISKAALECADYISLRDNISKDYIDQIYEDKGEESPDINIYPDSVCCIANLFSADQLSEIRKNVLNTEKKYAVIQFNPQRPIEQDSELVRSIKLLQSNGLNVVLLPLGYTHNDDNVLANFNNKYNLNCSLFSHKLNIFEMASVLAGCEIYIGASFHGAITAIAYGKKAISYNYINPKAKNKEIFAMYGLEDFVVETALEVYSVLEQLLNKKIAFEPQLSKVVDAVEEHFDKIYQSILSSQKSGADYTTLVKSLVNVLPNIAKLEQKNCILDCALETEKSNFINTISNLNKVIREKDQYINQLNNTVAELNNSIFQIRSSFFWRITAIPRKIIQVFKDFLANHPALLEMFIFTKGFLRGGIKGGKQKVEIYRKNNTQKDPQKISAKRRKSESSFKFDKDIKFSILVPLYNTPKNFLKEMIESVQNQTYKNWELCLADGSDEQHNFVGKYCKKLAKKDNRIKYKKLTENKGISENTNACIEMSTGEYIALFDHDDILHPSALFRYMQVICENGADFIYCDEDKFTSLDDEFYDHNFKVDFAPDNLRANNYICHFTVFKKSLLELTGGFRKEFDGSQDHDLVLRLTEQAKSIVHIPEVLYHWRISDASVASDPYAKPYTIEAGKNAVREHLKRVGLEGTVESSPFHPNIYKINYKIKGNPLVSILIPNCNHTEDLDKCIKSIINKSTYNNYEIIIIENNSNAETFKYYKTLEKYPQIKVVVYKTDTFNYSAINNFGAQFASGEHILLLNNDIEVISENWIEEMLMLSQREDVGIVGAKLYYPDDTIQHAGVVLGMGGVAGHIFRTMPRTSPGYFGRAIYVNNCSIVTFACAMMKKRIFDEVNGLDESFAVAFNDVDMCMRVLSAGYLNCFTPFAELYHYESISRGSDMDADKYDRFVGEVNRFTERWKAELDKGDAYYNKNLTLITQDCSLKRPEEN